MLFRKIFLFPVLITASLISLIEIPETDAQSPLSGIDQSLRPKMLLIGIDGLYLKTIEEQRLPFLDLFVRTSAVATNASSLYTLDESEMSLQEYNLFNWRSILSGTWAVDEDGAPAPSFIDHLESIVPEIQTIVLSSWREISENLVTDSDVSRFISSAQNSMIASDYLLTAEAKQALQAEETDLMFLYFGSALSVLRDVTFDVDHPRYLNALKELDTMLGEIRSAVISRRSYVHEDWIVVLINTQYINRTGGPLASPFKSYVVANGKNISPTHTFNPPVRLVDIYPTVIAHMTGSFSANPKLDGSVMKMFPEKESEDSRAILDSIQELAETNEQAVNRILQSQQESGTAVSHQTEALINKNMESLSRRIEALSLERREDLVAIQQSNQLTVLIVGGLFAITILGVLFSMWMQARAMRHLSTIVSALPNTQRLLQSGNGPTMALSETQLPPNQLIHTIGKLEKRIHELESSLDETETQNSYPESHPELFEGKKSLY